MKLSIIWRLSEKQNDNETTLSCLEQALPLLKEQAQLLVYPASKDQTGFLKQIDRNNADVCICKLTGAEDVAVYQDAAQRMTGTYVTYLYGGDQWSASALRELEKAVGTYSSEKILMLHKVMPDEKAGAFASDQFAKKTIVQNLRKKFYCYPFYFGGTVLQTEFLKEHTFDTELGRETERAFFLSLCAETMQVVYLPDAAYYSSRVMEGDATFYEGIYDPDWYDKSFTQYWISMLAAYEDKLGRVPSFIQYHLMFTIRSRILSNLNNRNKHVIPEGQERHCLELMGQALSYIEDDIMLNCNKIAECQVADSMKWIYGVLKHGEEFRFQERYLSGAQYYGSSNTVFNKITNLKTNILFMNYEDGYLSIDGTVHPILYSMADEVYFMFDGKKYPLRYTGRYALTKVFGVSVYKNHSFHVDLPMEQVKDCYLMCYANLGDESVKILLTYESHFSRMSGAYKNSYWCFGGKTLYMATKDEGGMWIRTTTAKERRRQERALSKEMFCTFTKRAWIFLAIRKVYFFMRPIMKRRPVWMYLDKIYKGGDSSEYLYRYASAQKDGIKHYYLIDKKSTDYKRLKKDGFKPLVRGSIKHRLVFLMADMMVISNSTVFAFNNYGLPNSSQVRDLVDFHVCCVQHGMSVQKIAVAQNRLRDNTRLYFCASKYELENLSRPIYDYVGYDALKLTGVPRYDGLVNDDKKQIMISPTWRMQAAVPVRTNEGEQRDYNPLFKESTYFQVFNSLINDSRLIEAAQKYGYRIKYVLHPIVSAQVDDFDKNDYVDVIPAVGDMSYERMFCESSLMVTDFSGIQFDFAYMRKPLVYLHHKDIPQHYEEGTFFYDTMAFGEIAHDNDELIDLLCEYMASGCKMKEEYVRRADDFFYYNDHNNCKRIYDTMISYQNQKIFCKQDQNSRADVCKEMLALAKENEIEIPGRTILDNYYDRKVQNNVVLVLGLGKNVRGNMQYILNELNHNNRYENFEIYVRTDPEETESIVLDFIKNNHWKRTKTVSNNGKYSELMETAKYLITEVYFPEGWIKRPEQVSINIWHGTPLKKLGLAKNSNNLHKDGNSQKNFINADYLLYPNEYTRQHMLESYKVSNMMYGKALMQGYPRTAGIIDTSKNEETLKLLAPNGETIYAYMPTWKNYLKLEQVLNESRELLDYLDDNLRDDQILYVNLHHKVSDGIDYSKYKHIKKFPPNIDSYQLQAATEALITDYSSVFYDYLASRKNIILYCADLELYEKKRGTYMDLRELPFHKARTKEEVLEAINIGKNYDDTEAFQTFCQYDSIDNAKRLCQLLVNDTRGLVIEDIPKDSRKKVLIYSEKLQKAESTARLESYTKICDKEQVDLYISCDAFAVDSNKKSAYPMLRENTVFGLTDSVRYSSCGKAVLQMYEKGILTLNKAMEYLKFDCALERKRAYGDADFDMMIAYEVNDADRLLTLCTFEKEVLVFVQESMLAMIEEGDRKLRDVIEYCAHQPRIHLVAIDEAVPERLSKALSEELTGQIEIVSDDEQFAAWVLDGKQVNV
jgi:CDP-glycerol glycerophosphotransferase (TagB/SpsB family)